MYIYIYTFIYRRTCGGSSIQGVYIYICMYTYLRFRSLELRFGAVARVKSLGRVQHHPADIAMKTKP